VKTEITALNLEDIEKLVIEQFSHPDGKIFKRFNKAEFENLVRKKDIDGITDFLFQKKESLEVITTRELMVAAGKDERGAFVYLQRLIKVKTDRISGIEKIIKACWHPKRKVNDQ